VHYVYILRSIAEPDRFYVGSSADLKQRLAYHNSGASTHTVKFRPWKLLWYSAFTTKAVAEQFETGARDRQVQGTGQKKPGQKAAAVELTLTLTLTLSIE
jgi:putative endonuclease